MATESLAPRRTPSSEVQHVYERLLAGSTVRSRFLELGTGGRVHLLEKGDGPPILFLHGTTAAAGMFLPLLDTLEGVRILAVDRPGHGLSDPIDLPPDRFPEHATAWLGEVLDGLGLESTALVGHSGGAAWALWFALARPDRVSRLVLMGPPSVPGTRCPLPVRVMATPGVGALLSRVAPPTPRRMLQFAKFMGEQATLAAHPDLVDLFVATGRDPVTDRAGRAEVRALASRFALLVPSGFRGRARIRRADLARLAPPTLVVWGEREPLGSVEVARTVTAMLPQGRLAVLPGGHAPWLGQPAECAAAIREFAG